jgi:hypothetical protein
MLRNAKNLKGYRLGALDGEIGKVRDFYFDDQTWTVRYLVADTGTWLPARQVLISPYALKKANETDEILNVDLSKKEIEASPPISADMPVNRQYEVEYYKYYGWPAYWYGPALWGPGPYPLYYGHGGGPAEPRVEKTHEGDPHLRSAQEVTGYYIQAKDGEIGHVEDFILDDENWAIRYMEIDTRNWWPGKKVLIAPQWIESVSWDQSKVFVSLLRETIKGAPEYDSEAGISRDYETRLFDFYDREAYWKREVPMEEHAHSH